MASTAYRCSVCKDEDAGGHVFHVQKRVGKWCVHSVSETFDLGLDNI